MADATIDLHAVKLMRSATLRVRLRGVRSYKVRTRIASRLIVLAAFVLGTGLDIDLESEGDGNARTEG